MQPEVDKWIWGPCGLCLPNKVNGNCPVLSMQINIFLRLPTTYKCMPVRIKYVLSRYVSIHWNEEWDLIRDYLNVKSLFVIYILWIRFKYFINYTFIESLLSITPGQWLIAHLSTLWVKCGLNIVLWSPVYAFDISFQFCWRQTWSTWSKFRSVSIDLKVCLLIEDHVCILYSRTEWRYTPLGIFYHS